MQISDEYLICSELFFQSVSEWKKGLSRVKNPFPRDLLSWFQSGGKGLGSCNRFQELNKLLLTAYFEVIQEHFFREVTFSIFDQGDGQKDDVTIVKKPKYVV